MLARDVKQVESMSIFETSTAHLDPKLEASCADLRATLGDIAFSPAGLGRDILVSIASRLIAQIRADGKNVFQNDQLIQIETELGFILPIHFA